MEIQSRLKQYGKSITQERVQIYQSIKDRHIFSAHDILEIFPQIGRASIFRTLKIFLEIGVIRRVPLSESGELLYECIADDHHHEHMKCLSCQKIFSFESHDLCNRIFEEAKRYGFEIREHSISILGLCKQCSTLRN